MATLTEKNQKTFEINSLSCDAALGISATCSVDSGWYKAWETIPCSQDSTTLLLVTNIED